MPISWNGIALAMTEPTLHSQCSSSRSLLRRGAAFPIERGPLHTPHGQGITSKSLMVRHGSHNETLFPHSGGEERRKKREKL